MSKNLVADPPPAAPGDGPRRRRSEPPSGRRPNRWKTVLAWVLGALLIVVGLVCGTVAYRVVHDHQPVPRSISEIFIPAPDAVFGKSRIYVLVLGTDFNTDERGMQYSKGSRSDSIKVVGVDFDAKAVKSYSILRDFKAIVNGHVTKINEAYSQGGVKLADQVIGEFMGLPKNENGTYFDRYVVINAYGLKDFVNAIGGIDVPITETMDYDDSWGNLHIHFKPGLQHLNGQHAMEYTRFRHDACSDVCRTQRQDQVVHIIVQKLKSQKINDLLHVGQLIAALNKNVMTNLSFDEEKSLAWAFRNVNLADVKTETLKYSAVEETPYAGEVAIPDPEQKAQMTAALLGAYGNVTPPPASAMQRIKPSTVHVVVQNGSGERGLAGTVSAKLTKLGYVVDSIGNADTFGYDTTQIRPASLVPYVGERVRADLGVPGATVTPATDATPGPRTVVTVIVGRDYGAAAATAVPTSSAAPAH
ncbi:MAG TPA: LCP family protein [Candidatus Elarobacter sp.]|jgi:LCP family protein required for cell wall assembly|nr:LCP family protein [Candidatus Elarobacter sp.]